MLSLTPDKKYKYNPQIKYRIIAITKLASFIIICAYYNGAGYSGMESFLLSLAISFIADIGQAIVRVAFNFLDNLIDRMG